MTAVRRQARGGHELLTRGEVTVDRPTSEPRSFGDRPHAHVTVLGQQPSNRVKDLRAIQRRVAALAALRRGLPHPRSRVAIVSKWNSVIHFVPRPQSREVFV
jgi:hypothetical protein